jgi:hypothetical protein
MITYLYWGMVVLVTLGTVYVFAVKLENWKGVGVFPEHSTR